MNMTLKQSPRSKHGGVIGSVFNSDEIGEVTAVGVLSCEQICKKHNLTLAKYQKIEQRLNRTQLSNALFLWPDGPYYDILLHRVAHSF